MSSPPRPEKSLNEITLHGVTWQDPYRWLRDDRWQEVMRNPERLAPKIREHLERENAHTDAVMDQTRALQEVLYLELKGRIKEDESSVPAKDGPFEYYFRYEPGAQHPRYCRRPAKPERDPAVAPSMDEEVLFDADAAAREHPYFSVRSVVHSRDHRHLGYGADSNGSEYYELCFRDLALGRDLADRIPSTSGNLVFSADGQTVFYTAVDAHHRPSRVYRHRLGTPADGDVLVYEELDPGFFVSLELLEDQSEIVITSHDHITSEQRLIDAHRPESAARLIAPRRAGVEYRASALGDELLLLTNAEARDFRLVVAPRAHPAPESWRDLVPHRPGSLILEVTTLAGHIIRLEQSKGLPRIVIRDRSDGREHTISLDEEAYSLGLSPGYEYDTQIFRFTYSSLTTPKETYEYDLAARQRTLLERREIPSGHDPSRYRSARLLAKSHDGAEVPISVLWHEHTRGGAAPLVLYGYGAYGHSVPAAFSSNVVSLVNRGFVYAIAHVRGGKEMGYAWYEAGKQERKPNTFLDFIAAAEHLCQSGWTEAGEITIHGGSAGGMLVGAAANLRPELFKAVIGEVPFVDVLNTMCDASLPLTPPEWPEWGNPLEDAEAFRIISAYSPYDNVAPKNYPDILATAGLTDPRVTYWEPAKWVARLRDMRTNDRLTLLRTYMQAGHGGAAGRFDRLREVAFVHAFILLANERLDAPVLPSTRR